MAEKGKEQPCWKVSQHLCSLQRRRPMWKFPVISNAGIPDVMWALDTIEITWQCPTPGWPIHIKWNVSTSRIWRQRTMCPQEFPQGILPQCQYGRSSSLHPTKPSGLQEPKMRLYAILLKMHSRNWEGFCFHYFMRITRIHWHSFQLLITVLLWLKQQFSTSGSQPLQGSHNR